VSARRVTRIEVARLLEVEEGFLVELERHDILELDPQGGYDRVAIDRARLSWTMHHALGVNMAGLEVALDLLERWQGERRRVRELVAQLRDQLERE
jgi:hypothetical protein